MKDCRNQIGKVHRMQTLRVCDRLRYPDRGEGEREERDGADKLGKEGMADNWGISRFQFDYLTPI